MPANSVIASLIGTVITAMIAAVIGFWLAKIRFKHDQLWQEKNITYKRVLGSVEAIRFWGEEVASDTHFLPTVDWYDGKSAHQFYGEALREISKQSVVGKVLLSSEFVDALTELMIEIFRERHEAMEERSGDPSYDDIAFGNHAAAVRDLVDAHLPKLISLARKDLGA
jgi:hypothetical protein